MAPAVVTVGGMGSSFSPTSVYLISQGLSKVKIDSSALEKLSQSNNVPTISPSNLSSSNPNLLTVEESRAALAVLLNKFLLAGSKIRPALPTLMEETINLEDGHETLDFGSPLGFLGSLCRLNGKSLDEIGVTSQDIGVIENSSAAASGMLAILDCSSSALVRVSDAVAALSAEAVGIDRKVFELLSSVSGERFSFKDEVDVAGDLNAFLSESNLADKFSSGLFSQIPTVHGSFRKTVRDMHSIVRVELNSTATVKETIGVTSIWYWRQILFVGWMLPLATSIWYSGENSLKRMRMAITSISNQELQAKVFETVERGHSSYACKENFRLLAEKLSPTSDLFHVMRCLRELLVNFREMLAWEAAVAMFVLDSDESIEKPQVGSLGSIKENGDNAKGEKKSAKKQMKSLGRGTSIVRQLFNDRLMGGTEVSVGNVAALGDWAHMFLVNFDPKDSGLDSLLSKLKEIVASNDNRRLPKLPKGTRDFAKEQMDIRERAFSIIVNVFKRHGAVTLDTPLFELRETPMIKYWEDSKLRIDLDDQGGELCSLRSDLTVPFARYLATNNISSLKRYHIAKVYRTKGRYREFFQCDFDIAGQADAMEHDFEVVKVLTELLNDLDIGDYEIKLNHRKLLDGMLEICGVPYEKFRTVCSSIDKLDKQSFEQVKRELVEEKGLTAETADKIGAFVKKRGPPLEVLSELKSMDSQFLENNGSVQALKDLETLFNSLKGTRCLDKVVFDLSLARGLDYYTGVVFEAVFKGSTQVGSIAAGGRYDNLVGMFSGKQVPVVGVSLEIERVFTIMEQLEQERSQVHMQETLDIGSPLGVLGSLCRLNVKSLDEIGVTSQEIGVIENSSAAASGMLAILDCSSSAFVRVSDAVAALSAEVVSIDTKVFELLSSVSREGLSFKDEVDVAGDLKVFLSESKLADKVYSGLFSQIPIVHGSFRSAARTMHSIARVELNSIVKVKETIGVESKVRDLPFVTSVLPLATFIWSLGENSLERMRMVITSISNHELHAKVLETVERGSFNACKENFRLLAEKISPLSDLFHVMRCLCELLVNFREMLAWEAAVAMFVLDSDESIEKPQFGLLASIKEKGENAKGEKKSARKKMKTLGRGTSIVRQLFNDRLMGNNEVSVGNVAALGDCAQRFLLYFDPKDSGLESLLSKLKEIVERNDNRRLPKIPKGTRDFSKEQMTIRERAFSIIVNVFKRHGAGALDTPVFELRETLMEKYGEDSKLIFDLADQDGELCSLRYDLTVPFARYLATNSISALKRYHIAKVYRRDTPSKGRYREFYQCDFDIAGQYDAMKPDSEVVKVLTELLNELDIGDYEIKLNHRKLLDGMLEICGVPCEKFRTVCSSIDKLDKQSFEQVKRELVEEKGLTAETAEKIGAFVKKRGPPLEVLLELKSGDGQFLENNGSVQALNDLEILFKSLEESKCLDKVVFDLSLARGLDYYTGVIFEAVFKGSTQVGSIAAGGRYDNLVGMFSGKQVPAVGVSLGIERVFTIMEQLEQERSRATRATETQVLVAILGKDLLMDGEELVSELWDANIFAEFEQKKRVMYHINRAIQAGIPWMVIVGENEVSKGVVKLKNIVTKQEEEIRRCNIVDELRIRLNITGLCLNNDTGLCA